MQPDPQPLQVAVIGVGRMGRQHARTYARLKDANLVAVVDPDDARVRTVADELGCQPCLDPTELLTRFPHLNAVSVAVPTQHHAAVASPLLERKIACLVEKPLAPTSQAAKALADLATRHNTVLQVGHTERFNPAVQAVAAMNLNPRFMEIDRVSPMTFRSLDIGVVMDMMIHDLDIVLMLADSPLEQVQAVGVAVLGAHEDVANARLVFASGCVANLTASRLAMRTQRKLRIFNENHYVSLDYAQRNGIIIRKTDNALVLKQIREQLAAGTDLAGVDYSELVNIDQLTMDDPGPTNAGADQDANPDPLTRELTTFLDAARTGQAHAVDGGAGFAAVEAAERVVEAIQSHRWQGLTAAEM